jgi:hypothetical protein
VCHFRFRTSQRIHAAAGGINKENAHDQSSFADRRAAALALAGCGGGGNTAMPRSQQSSQVAVGEPNGGSACSNLKNRLWLIDGKQVFWDRAGIQGRRFSWAGGAYKLTTIARHVRWDLSKRAF